MKRIVAMLALGAALSTPLIAQFGETDPGEASLSIGSGFGATGTNVAFSGAIGALVDRYASIFMESGYTPMGYKTFRSNPPGAVRASGLFAFSVTGHVLVPVSRKWEPYGIIAPTFLDNHYQKAGTRSNGDAYYFGVSDLRFGFQTGGGIRYYWKEDWGFKGEYRYTISVRNFSAMMFGVFRQF